VGTWQLITNPDFTLEFKNNGTYKTNGSTLTTISEGESGTFVFSNNNNSLTIDGFSQGAAFITKDSPFVRETRGRQAPGYALYFHRVG
jgi:short subunit dehydrogenase-like uncharacterized protein